jgi:hypothetical protein
MKLVTTGDKLDQKFYNMLEILSENIPEVEDLIIINQEEEIVENKISENMEKYEYHVLWLKFFSFTISLRFPIAGFNTQLGGLEMTVNLFKEKAVMVKMLDKEYMVIVIVPRTPQNISSAITTLSDI